MPNSEFLEAQLAYEKAISIDTAKLIDALDSALVTYGSTPNDPSGNNVKAVKDAFAPIASYYSSLEDAIKQLQGYINKAAKNISDSGPRLVNEERYVNKVHPEDSVEAREVSYSLIPELRLTSLPYLISASVFMALFSIFMIFNMWGFTGQVNIPQSMLQMFTPGTTPLLSNPLFTGSIIIALVVLVIAFGLMYYKAKNSNTS